MFHAKSHKISWQDISSEINSHAVVYTTDECILQGQANNIRIGVDPSLFLGLIYKATILN